MRVAITGGVGEGKSTVLAYLGLLGYPTASSDEIAREVLSDPETQREVADGLGYPTMPTREELRLRIANDPGARRILNRVTHPRIVRAIQSHSATFVEVPLLFEACLYGMFDRVWIVTCGRDLQRARLTKRYGSIEKAETMMATQLPTEAKLPFADAIIRTNREHGDVHEEVAGLVATAVGG